MRARAKVYCSFCGKEGAEVESLINGPGDIAICNECIDLLHDMIHGNAPPPGQLAIDLAEHPKRKALRRGTPAAGSGT